MVDHIPLRDRGNGRYQAVSYGLIRGCADRRVANVSMGDEEPI